MFATNLLPIHARWFHARLSFVATICLTVLMIQLNDILSLGRGNSFGADEYAMFSVAATVAKDVGAKVFPYQLVYCAAGALVWNGLSNNTIKFVD